MAANPDITLVDEVYVDADIPLKVETAVTANQEPELVFTGGIGNAFTWVKSGVAVAVNDYLTEWGLADKFLDSAISQYSTADGTIIAFPSRALPGQSGTTPRSLSRSVLASRKQPTS